MNKLSTLVAGVVAALGFATAAQAQEATRFDTTIDSQKSRAEVRAEAVAAVRAGELSYGEASQGYAFDGAATDSAKSRTQVAAEAREAQRLGVLNRGEASVFVTAEQAEQIRAAGLRAAGVPVASLR